MHFPELPQNVAITHPLMVEVAARSLGVPAAQVKLSEQKAEGNAHGQILRQVRAEANGEDVRLVYVRASNGAERWRVI